MDALWVEAAGLYDRIAMRTRNARNAATVFGIAVNGEEFLLVKLR